MFRKINAFFGERKEDVWVFFIIVLVALLAFGLGRLSALYGADQGIRIIYPENSQPAAAVLSGGGGYVASRTGSVYYFPWCGTVGRIKPANIVRFDTKEQAERAGYRPGNCSGL